MLIDHSKNMSERTDVCCTCKMLYFSCFSYLSSTKRWENAPLLGSPLVNHQLMTRKWEKAVVGPGRSASAGLFPLARIPPSLPIGWFLQCVYTNQKNKTEQTCWSTSPLPHRPLTKTAPRKTMLTWRIWCLAACEWHWKPINFLSNSSCDCVSSRHQIGLCCFFWTGHNRVNIKKKNNRAATPRQKRLCPNPLAVIGDTSILIESKSFSTGDIWAELSYGTFAHEWYSTVGWIKDRRTPVISRDKTVSEKGRSNLEGPLSLYTIEELSLMLSKAIQYRWGINGLTKTGGDFWQVNSWHFCYMWTLWSGCLMQETCELNLIDGVRVTRLN